MSPHPSILVLAAHPNLRHSRVNRALMQVGSAMSNVTVRDLYALYPDHMIDVPVEQDLASAADLLVWLHPIQWYSMPSLMKLWLDEVLTLGWAYGRGGHALRGKHLWLVATTGGSQEAYSQHGYNRYPFEAFLPPYEQTSNLCGMRFLPPLILHGAHAVTKTALEAHVEIYRERLRTYPDWPEMVDLPSCPRCEVPGHHRPIEGG